MDPRFPPLAPPEDHRRSRAIAVPAPPVSAFPLAEWAVFAALLSLLLRV